MKRNAIEQLKKWKENPRRKPLLLLGARQVGKTWLMKEFGRQCFEQVAYVRFDNSARARDSFSKILISRDCWKRFPLKVNAVYPRIIP